MQNHFESALPVVCIHSKYVSCIGNHWSSLVFTVRSLNRSTCCFGDPDENFAILVLLLLHSEMETFSQIVWISTWGFLTSEANVMARERGGLSNIMALDPCFPGRLCSLIRYINLDGPSNSSLLLFNEIECVVS